jgi:glycosyltransferase involved in cell wall biosynthesis
VKILIDIQAAVGSNRTRGLGRYSWQLAKALAAREDLDVELLANAGVGTDQALAFRSRVHDEMPGRRLTLFDAPWPWNVGRETDVIAHRHAEEVRAFAVASREPDVVLIASLFESPSESVCSIPVDRDYAAAVVAYDLLPLTDPTCAPPAREVQMYQHRLASLERADAILAISDHTAREVARLLPSTTDRLSTIWGAAFPMPRSNPVQRRAPLVCAAGAHERKNVASTIAAYGLLPEALRQRHPLTIVGNFAATDIAKYRDLAEPAGLRGDLLHFPGEVSDRDLGQIYRSAVLVVMPSLGEGLGLPILEAWEAGTPVVASNTTSLAELVNDPDYSFDPLDVDDQAATIRRLLEDEQAWRRACEFGQRRSESFTWPATAQRTLEALKRLPAQHEGRREHASGRPSLALVTPWPPDLSGVARHARQLAPQLATRYDVSIVPETPAGARAAASEGWPTVRPESIIGGDRTFDRVVYNIGNNPQFHSVALDMSSKVPGVFVAHDVNLRGLLTGTSPAAAAEAEVRAYLENGLRAVGEAGVTVGMSVLGRGLGVVTHSLHARDVVAGCLLVPEGRGPTVRYAPLLLLRDATGSMAEAKASLGLDPACVVIATFGLVAPHKGIETLVRAFSQMPASTTESMLAIIGGGAPDGYEAHLRALAADHRVVFTGSLDDPTYDRWLCAADIAVQLRPESMGETSGAAIEALAHSCAVIVERSGSMSELEQLGAIGVDSPVEPAHLALRLSELVEDGELRRTSAATSASITHERHAPSAVVARYSTAIEDSYRRRWVPTPSPGLPDAGLYAISRNLQAAVRPSILVDVSRLSRTRDRTGSERVSMALSRELARATTDKVFLVGADGAAFAHVPEFLDHLEGRSRFTPGWRGGKRHATATGDVLLSAELMLDDPGWQAGVLAHKAAGGHYIQIVHDILPLQLPEFFVRGLDQAFERWLGFVTRTADLVVCDSRATLDAVEEWRRVTPPGQAGPAPTEWFRLGCDFGLVSPHGPLMWRPRGRRRVLVVGTIEPRKGIEVVMDAAEHLAAQGEDVEFIIVGRRGWAMPSVIERLERLSRSGAPLTWVQEASDDDLQWEYLNSDLLVMASRGEGFGLPVVEAISHGLPVLARDLPVFRELLGDEGDYFRLDSELPAAILERLHSTDPVRFDADRLVTWAESAKEVLGAISRVRT